MREIKFRAWDQINNKMLSEGLPHLGEGKYFYLNQMISLCREQKMILEQFIGLKDKNGKEIYEGDILRYGRVGGGVETAPVIYRDYASFGMKNMDFGACRKDEGWEVIGNIHENGYLLNENKSDSI